MPRRPLLGRPGSAVNPSPTQLVVFLDREVVLDRRDVLGTACDRNRFVDCGLTVSRTAEPYDAIGIRIDVNIAEAGQVLGSKLRFDLGRDDRVLDEGLGILAIHVGIIGGKAHARRKRCA